MIYLDTAAIVKLVRVEVESAALVDWLNQRPAQPLVASALVAEGDEVVVRERAASAKHLGWGNMASRHYPLLPAGSVFLTQLSDGEVTARIEKAKSLTQ